jgi:hypothetical protein
MEIYGCLQLFASVNNAIEYSGRNMLFSGPAVSKIVQHGSLFRMQESVLTWRV